MKVIQIDPYKKKEKKNSPWWEIVKLFFLAWDGCLLFSYLLFFVIIPSPDYSDYPKKITEAKFFNQRIEYNSSQPRNITELVAYFEELVEKENIKIPAEEKWKKYSDFSSKNPSLSLSSSYLEE